MREFESPQTPLELHPSRSVLGSSGLGVGGALPMSGSRGRKHARALGQEWGILSTLALWLSSEFPPAPNRLLSPQHLTWPKGFRFCVIRSLADTIFFLCSFRSRQQSHTQVLCTPAMIQTPPLPVSSGRLWVTSLPRWEHVLR